LYIFIGIFFSDTDCSAELRVVLVLLRKLPVIISLTFSTVILDYVVSLEVLSGKIIVECWSKIFTAEMPF